MADFGRNRGGDLLIAGQVTAEHLHIKGSRQAKINRLAHNVGGKKIKGDAWKITIEC